MILLIFLNIIICYYNVLISLIPTLIISLILCNKVNQSLVFIRLTNTRNLICSYVLCYVAFIAMMAFDFSDLKCESTVSIFEQLIVGAILSSIAYIYLYAYLVIFIGFANTINRLVMRKSQVKQFLFPAFFLTTLLAIWGLNLLADLELLNALPRRIVAWKIMLIVFPLTPLFITFALAIYRKRNQKSISFPQPPKLP